MAECARAYAATRSWTAALAPLYQAYREVAHACAPGVDSLHALPQRRAS
jgi:hypothetical protein